MANSTHSKTSWPVSVGFFIKGFYHSSRLLAAVVVLLIPIYLIVLPWTHLPDVAMKTIAPVLPWALIASAFTENPVISLLITFLPLLALAAVVCRAGSSRWRRFVIVGSMIGVCYGLAARIFLACVDIA